MWCRHRSHRRWYTWLACAGSLAWHLNEKMLQTIINNKREELITNFFLLRWIPIKHFLLCHNCILFKIAGKNWELGVFYSTKIDQKFRNGAQIELKLSVRNFQNLGTPRQSYELYTKPIFRRSGTTEKPPCIASLPTFKLFTFIAKVAAISLKYLKHLSMI